MIKDILTKNETKTPDSKALSVLKEHFPGCFEKDGSFDMERFKELLSDKVEVRDEGYELRFLGKNYARLLASLDTTTVVVPNEEHNGKPENKDSENIYITGDNLDGLKHLLKSYAGKIKCIYIDPPYNTGSDDFVYKDSFSFTAENLSEKLSISEEKALRILDLTKRGSASHSAWLMFMYPRLLLARDLLTEDGVIFISIDNNEYANLKLLCDDIFGEENFESNIITIVNPGGRDYKQVAVTNEYLLCYGKSDLLELNEVPKEVAFTLFDSNGGYTARELRNRNPKFHSANRPNLFYPFYVNPNVTKDGFCAVSLEKTTEYSVEVKPYNSSGKESVWRWGKIKSNENIVLNDMDQSQIIAKQKRDGNWNIYEKNRRSTTKVKSLWDETEMRTEEGTRSFRSLFGETYFDHPKPVELIKKCILIGSNEGDMVLDFFSGSATTAQAIIELNSENIEESRNWVLVQLPESIEEGKAAFKAGYKTIDEIGIDRIKKVAAKIKAENPETELDLGFKHYSLQEPSQNTLDKILEFDPANKTLFGDRALLDEFGETTILRTWLASDGYGLTEEAQELDLDGYKAYLMKNHLYLIDAGIEDESIEDLVVRYETDPAFNPENLIVFGYSFTWRQMEQLQINLKRLKGTEKNLSINIDVRY
jgi:adenine-specific DNA-methyltransferase